MFWIFKKKYRPLTDEELKAMGIEVAEVERTKIERVEVQRVEIQRIEV